jgi:hypothetical protein
VKSEPAKPAVPAAKVEAPKTTTPVAAPAAPSVPAAKPEAPKTEMKK